MKNFISVVIPSVFSYIGDSVVAFQHFEDSGVREGVRIRVGDEAEKGQPYLS